MRARDTDRRRPASAHPLSPPETVELAIPDDERVWIATEGSYVFEPPGETHTLVVDEDCGEMITFFNISGCMCYVDEQGRCTGFEDAFAKLDMCRRHYSDVGLGAGFVDRFVR